MHDRLRIYDDTISSAFNARVYIAGDTSFAPLIRDGDMVVFFEGREPAGFDRMKPKTIWQCRHGAFHHDEIIGKPFGSRVSKQQDAAACCVRAVVGAVLTFYARSYTRKNDGMIYV